MPKTKIVTFRLDEEELARVKKVAERQRSSVSNVITRSLLRYLAKAEQEIIRGEWGDTEDDG